MLKTLDGAEGVSEQLLRGSTSDIVPCSAIVMVWGDSMERYPERCFQIIAPGQPKFDFNTSSISPLYETSYKNIIFYYKQIKIMSIPQ